MTGPEALLPALAAALAPRDAPALLARASRARAGPEVAGLAALPRAARLGALAAALARPAPPRAWTGEGPWMRRALARARLAPTPGGAGTVPGHRLLRRVACQLADRAASGSETRVRPAERPGTAERGFPTGGPAARPVNDELTVLPFDIPAVGRGRADLDPVVRALGDRAARAAAEAMTSALGLEVRLRGRPLPAGASLGSATLVPLDLPALPASAVLAVECSLAARLAERLAGGPGDDWLASALTPAESAVLDLLVLAGLLGLGRIDEVEAALAPRLGLRPAHVESPLAIDLSVEAGEVAGRALLALPLSAVRALRGPPELGGAIERVTIEGSLRSGQVRLEPDELAAVEPGDVLLLDAPPGGTARLSLRGGAEVAGRLAAGELKVEEVGMARVTDVAAGLPLLLEVELGRVPVALGDLARLEVGGVLPLGLDRSGRVTLRLGERELAVGELVDVDGSVGVRVLRLAGQP